ncbi:MAG: class I SAM-dependent methyltransferase [Neisseriaceae bacterium]|nr:MAG: class I SAM-dependent methyltransferase [Neisseriaceae bacterium]
MLFIDKKKEKMIAPKFGFENYFIKDEKNVETWAYTDTKRKVLSPFFESLFKNKRVLDVGSGAGFFSWLAAEYGAIPFLNETLKEALEQANKLNFKNKFNFRNDNMIINLDKEEEKKFDYLIALTVIHWLWKPIGEEENHSLLKRSNISYRFPPTKEGLEEVFDRLDFYTKNGIFIDFFRNKETFGKYQKDLFEKVLFNRYEVSILKQVNESHFDSTIYFLKL